MEVQVGARRVEAEVGDEVGDVAAQAKEEEGGKHLEGGEAEEHPVVVHVGVADLVCHDGADLLDVGGEMRDQRVVDDDALGAEEARDVCVRVRRLARAVHLEEALASQPRRAHELLDARAHRPVG